MSLTKKIWVMMGLNDKEFQTKMTAVTQKLRTVQSQSVRDARRLSITTQEMFYGMTLPMGLFAKTVIDATKQIESLHLGLATIAKSKGITNIEGLIKSATALAKLPGLGLAETFRGVKDLISVGFGAKEALRTVEGLGIGIARAGGNAETFGRVMTQLTQALSKGKLEMQDFKTVFEQMPEARGLLEKAFGPGMSDLQKLRDKGIGVKEVLKALVDGFQDLGAKGFMDTIANKIENLSDSWLQFRAAIGGSLFKDQINSVLDGLANGLEKATDAINNMSPEMKTLVQETAKWFAIIAVGLPAMTFIAKMFLLLKAQAAGLAAAFLRMNPYLRALAVGLLGIETAGKALDKNWQGLIPEAKLMARQLKALWDEAVKWGDRNSLFPGLKKADEPKHFMNIPKGARRDLSAFGEEARRKEAAAQEKWLAGAEDRAKAAEKLKKELEDLAKAHEKVLEVGLEHNGQMELAISLSELWKRQGKDWMDSLTKVSSNFMARGDIASGLRGADPLPNMSSEDQAKVLFASDENIQQVDKMAIKMKELRDTMNEIFAGPIADGIVGVADSFGVFIGTVLNDAPDAFGAMADAMKDAIKSMIVALVKLIVKLALAAALWALFAPAGAAKGLGGLKDFLGGSGGSGFLGSLLKGITGFHDGGIAGGSSKYGDKILARVNSGELMLNPSQQESVYNAMNRSNAVRVYGELKVRGRDLVYVFETTKKQINATR